MDNSFQYYIGGIRSNQPSGLVTIKTFLDKHKNPSDKITQLLDSIALASSKGDKKQKTVLKEKLPFVTPSVIVDKYRRYANIEKFTGLAQIDFDGVENASELKHYLFKTYPQMLAVYTSPSLKGVKGLIRIPICSSVEEYQDYYRALEEEFEGIYGFDPAPRNAVLPLFFSFDFFLLQRDNPTIWDKKKIKEKSFNEQYPLPPRPYNHLKSNDKNKRRAVNTIRKAINSIVDTPGHEQLRTACLILGSRVGAGYLDYQTAYNEVEYLIRTNGYLQKGVKGYITTSRWSIDEGILKPSYY